MVGFYYTLSGGSLCAHPFLLYVIKKGWWLLWVPIRKMVSISPYHYWEGHPFLFKISAILERIGKGSHLFRIDQDF